MHKEKMAIGYTIMKFKKLSTLTFIGISCVMLLLLSSCEEPNEKAHPAYQAALKAFENHDYPTSAKKFEEYLDFNRTSAKTHLKLAKLYGDYLDNPFLEAYHYRRYLVYEPNCADKEDIKAWIAASEKKFAEKIISEYPDEFTSQDEIDNLKETQRKLIKYMKKLKNEISLLRTKKTVQTSKHSNSSLSKTSENTGEVTASKSDKIKNPTIKTYTVKKGDTLSKISKNIYGSSKYYTSIYQANTNKMRSESDLKIGMTLVIPDID